MATVGTLNINFATNVGTLISDMGKASSSVKKTSDSMSKSLAAASRGIKGLVAGYASISGLKAFVSASSEVQLLSDRIRLSTQSVQEFRQAYAGLNQIVATTGTSLQAQTEIFQRLSLSRSEINATVQEMLQFTETVAKFGVVSGASSDALKFGLLQLGQSLSAGVVRAEEFNSIMENIPMVGKAIADEFGITTGQLRMLVLDGSVLSKDVFAALLNQAEKANEQFEGMRRTVPRAISEGSEALKLMALELDRSWGISQDLVKTIDMGTESLKWMAIAAITVADGLHAVVNAGKIAAKTLDVDFAKGYNNFADKNNGKLFGKIKLGKFDTSKREAEIAALTTSTAGLRTGSDLYNQYFPKETGEKAPLAKRTISQDYAGMVSGAKASSAEVAKLTDRVNQGRSAMVHYGRSVEDMRNVMQDAAMDGVKRLDNQLVSMITNATSAKDVLRGLAGEAINFLQNLIFAQAGLTGDGGLLSSLAGKLFNSFAGGSLYSMSSSGVPIPGVKPARAIGGPVAAGREYLVGERGPELFTPRSGGMITANNRMGGGGSTYYIDARGADQAAIAKLEDTIRRLNGSIERRALAAVQSENQRNPRYLA